MSTTQSPSTRDSRTLPKIWVGYIFAVAFFVVEVAEGISDPTAADRVTLLDVLIALGGLAYWLFCVYRMHKVLADVTNGTHPISPGQAVGNHFIPLYNLYWLFKWSNEIGNFVNSRVPSKHVARGWAGFLLLIGYLLGRVDAAISLAVIFSVGLYLTRRIRGAIEPKTSR